jgi:hypothetical protein
VPDADPPVVAAASVVVPSPDDESSPPQAVMPRVSAATARTSAIVAFTPVDTNA